MSIDLFCRAIARRAIRSVNERIEVGRGWGWVATVMSNGRMG
jgi:hypothetical protein